MKNKKTERPDYMKKHSKKDLAAEMDNVDYNLALIRVCIELDLSRGQRLNTPWSHIAHIANFYEYSKNCSKKKKTKKIKKDK